MSLHGTIEVNRVPIGWWSAKRIAGSDDADSMNTYEARVHTIGDQGCNWRGDVEHRHGDGAVVLAAKVLAAAVVEEPLSVFDTAGGAAFARSLRRITPDADAMIAKARASETGSVG